MGDQILPTSSRPSSGFGGKIVPSSHVDNSGINKKKEKIGIPLKMDSTTLLILGRSMRVEFIDILLDL